MSVERITPFLLRELPFRIVQQWHILLDRTIPFFRFCFSEKRVNIKNQVLSEISSFLEGTGLGNLEDRFFASFSSDRETREVFRSQFQHRTRQVIEEAKSILRQEFTIFGRTLSFGSPVAWNYDPVNHRRSSHDFYADIDYLDFDSVGDHKIVWELNRHQHFLALARAYWITGEEKYTMEWISQIEHWIQSNPFKLGINWASSLEIALRSISWIWSYLFFRKSKLLSSYFLTQYLLCLYINGCHIERNLSFYFSPNTHLTGEALGLMYLGLFFHGTKKGERWLAKGRSILEEQLDIHIEDDGTYFEKSSYYHRYTTDIYLHAYILLARNKKPITEKMKSKLQQMLDYLVMTQKPDGKTPLIGDDDGGKLLFLGGNDCDDFRNCLSTGAVLFGREAYKARSGGYSEETLWLLGPDSYRVFHKIDSRDPSVQSTGFPSGGSYVMRNGWGERADYLMVDCGVHGWKNGGHAHSDLLSIIVSIRGKELLIDPGTFTYVVSQFWRDHFRSSTAHNTFSIDGLSQSMPDGIFSWRHTAVPLSCRWITRKEFDYFSGSAKSYEFFPEPVFHRRDILFLKREGFWVIYDRIEADRERDISLYFHFPSEDVRLQDGHFVVSDGMPYGAVVVLGPAPFDKRLEDDWRSVVYSRKEPAKTGICRAKNRQSAAFLTLAGPYPFPCEWQDQWSKQCASLTAYGKKGRELIKLSFNHEAILRRDSDRIHSDFSVVMSRTNEDISRPLLIDGTRFIAEDIGGISFSGKADELFYRWLEGGIELIFSPQMDYEWESFSSNAPVFINGKRIR
ncbi:MAG: alginate lyase family protein [Syntrophales bacterium]